MALNRWAKGESGGWVTFGGPGSCRCRRRRSAHSPQTEETILFRGAVVSVDCRRQHRSLPTRLPKASERKDLPAAHRDARRRCLEQQGGRPSRTAPRSRKTCSSRRYAGRSVSSAGIGAPSPERPILVRRSGTEEPESRGQFTVKRYRERPFPVICASVQPMASFTVTNVAWRSCARIGFRTRFFS